MDLEFAQQYKGFWLLQEEYIEEIESVGRVLQHQKSGIKVIHIENKDPHKVFCVAFHTPPENNKGAAHIVEHTVCCASLKYPLKETFMALEKGSLCTSLNACTYPDMTMYYGASLNEKDLIGIMSVYMDMVLHPLMEKAPYLFKQEGWHYTLEEDTVGISGVVYHEMLGEYGEPITRLEHIISENLFKDTFYRFDSGGIPQEIIKLSYEELMDFYHKHYAPHQGVIYLYGDMHLEELLKKIDEMVLEKADISVTPHKLYPVTSNINQKAPDLPMEVYETYPVVEEEENQTLMSLSFVIDTALNPELRLAFELLEHMLLRSSASPLAKAIVVEGHLGISLGEGGYDTSRYQPVFSIQLKGAKKEDAKAFEALVLKSLKQLVIQGIDQELIEAALHTLAFELREVDASYEPVGLQYGEMIFGNYFYGGDPFAHLKYKAHVAHIEAHYKKGYFEALIQKYLLDNMHRVLVVLTPDEALEQYEHHLIEAQIQDFTRNFTKKDYKDLKVKTMQLEALQMMQNSEEDLRCLPKLKKEELELTVPEVTYRELLDMPFKSYFQGEATKGISYIHVLFNTKFIPQEDLVYLGLLGHLLTYVGTQSKSYDVLENAINRLTGGLNCSLQAYSHIETGNYEPYFKITSKVLKEEISEWRELMVEILTQSVFTEKAKIKEVVGNIQYELARSFEGAPEYRATRRVFALFASAGQYEDMVSGIRFYEFIKDFYMHFDVQFEKVMAKLEQIYVQIVSRRNLLVYITAEESECTYLKNEIEKLGAKLPDTFKTPQKYDLSINQKSEAYCTMQKVTAIAKGFDFKKAGYTYHGSMEVAAQIIESTYLWDRIRLQGGAYGCDLLMSRDGHLVTCSYCDPKLKETLDVFEGIGDFLRELSLNKEELERYIIHTIGALQTPISMEQKSERGLMYLLCEMSSTQLQLIMHEIFDTTLEKIKELAPLFDAFAKAPYLCVVGSRMQVKNHKKYFECIID